MPQDGPSITTRRSYISGSRPSSFSNGRITTVPPASTSARSSLSSGAAGPPPKTRMSGPPRCTTVPIATISTTPLRIDMNRSSLNTAPTPAYATSEHSDGQTTPHVPVECVGTSCVLQAHACISHSTLTHSAHGWLTQPRSKVMKFGMGQPVRRREDDRLLRGAGRYVSDIVLPGQAHAAVARSPVAHGRLIAVDATAARAVPGVLAVYTHEEIAGRLRHLGNEFPMQPAPAPVTMPHLAKDRVWFVGQPVAFVVAESRAIAEEAAALIEPEIEDLPVVTDPVAALAGDAVDLHPEAPGNLAYEWEHGDRAETDRLFAEAAHVVRTGVLNQRLIVAAMEPRAINIRHDPATGRWEGWVGCQGAHGMRGRIANGLGVEPSRLRIHVPDVGGAFGMKLMTHPEYALAALAAEDTGRPVKWVGDRSESFLSDAQG